MFAGEVTALSPMDKAATLVKPEKLIDYHVCIWALGVVSVGTTGSPCCEPAEEHAGGQTLEPGSYPGHFGANTTTRGGRFD